MSAQVPLGRLEVKSLASVAPFEVPAKSFAVADEVIE
jgi:hypothetical protein